MGFRAGVGTRDQIFNLRMIMEKAREHNTPLYLAFVDYKKAFDSVKHRKLWRLLRRMGVCATTVRTMKSLYSSQTAAVKVEGELSDWFDVSKGVRQGCLVSPLMYNLYSEEVLRKSADDMSWIGIRISGRQINNLRYADDIVLIATSKEELQRLLDKLNQVSGNYGMRINTKKTKVMAATRNGEILNISVSGKRLEQVDCFKYLGSLISKESDCSKEIRARLGTARTALKDLDKIWKERSLRSAIKLRVVRTLVWPVAIYGCEAWTIKAADLRRLEAFEMVCYRRILNVHWTMRRTNESILEELGVTRSFVSFVKKLKLQYFGHVVRAENLCTHILHGRVHGARPRGRPRRRWLEDIREWTGRTAADCTALARDRRRWRTLINASIVPNPHP